MMVRLIMMIGALYETRVSYLPHVQPTTAEGGSGKRMVGVTQRDSDAAAIPLDSEPGRESAPHHEIIVSDDFRSFLDRVFRQ